MKVFLGGSKTAHKMPPTVADRLDGLIRECAEFFVGDCTGADTLFQKYLAEKGYCGVTVFASGNAPRNNAGEWPVRLCKAHGQTNFRFYREKDETMAAEADCGLMVWEGGSKGTFLNMVDLLLQGKSVELHTASPDRIQRLRELRDLRKALPPRKEGPSVDISSLLDVFMPSEPMRAYLKGCSLSKFTLGELIVGAPVSLEEKAKWLKKLGEGDDLLHEILDEMERRKTGERLAFLYESVKNMQIHRMSLDVRQAIKGLSLKPGEMFLLVEKWFDHDYYEENQSSGVPFLSLESAVRYIRQMMAEEEWTADTKAWTELEKWVPMGNGDMRNTYTYTFLRDASAYFEKKKEDVHRPGFSYTKSFRYSTASRNLNLPIPFRSGDLVILDGLPFLPVTNAVILEEGTGCCEVTALFRDENGLWNETTVKHGHVGRLFGRCSLLYQLRPLTDEIQEGEGLLKTASQVINGSQEIGSRIWTAIFLYAPDEGLTDQQLSALLLDIEAGGDGACLQSIER